MLVAKNILPETARILQCRYLRSRLGNALSEPLAWDKSWGAQKYSPKARQRWARCWLPKISCQVLTVAARRRRGQGNVSGLGGRWGCDWGAGAAVAAIAGWLGARGVSGSTR